MTKNSPLAKKKAPAKKAPKPKKFNKDEKRIIKQANALVQPLGCEVSGLGPQSVGVLGDARAVGVAVVVKIPEGLDFGVISTMITNRVKGITRVLLDIPMESSS